MKLNVLAFNWRDIEHTEAGGAEVHLHEILRWLARRGHSVTLLSSMFEGCRAETEIDGIRVLRRGKWYNANFALPLAYLRELRSQHFDVVLEDINKIPFFTPCFVKCPVLAVVPHLFGTTVFREASFPFAMYVYSYELLIPFVYRNVRFLVISESTKADLVKRGIRAERVDVVECGLDHTLYKEVDVPRESKLVIYLGRLRKYKCVHLLLHAMTRVRKRVPEARLVVVGDGPYRASLERLSRSLGLDGVVEFKGHVDAREKVRLLCRASVTANPSPKEGWGLTVVEANACGVPVVASRSPGLVDSVRDGETGFLVEHGDVEQLAAKIVDILVDEALRQRLSRGALQWAEKFNWKDCARRSAEVVQHTAEGGGFLVNGGGSPQSPF
ncbi:MAG: glycosyltransferase family 4 protein [Candidatus Eiseniibacteriota bacterium]|nr:MAG: glycosyltransferase family 4 protein [Candidatus Eisenbacteria bacterium]